MKTLKYFPLFAFLFGLLSTTFAEQLSAPQLLSPTLGTTLSANAQPKFDLGRGVIGGYLSLGKTENI